MKSHYRSLLPGPGPGPQDFEDGNEDKQRRRKKRTRVACNNCRTKKASCNGEQPACARCITEKLTCQYVTTNGKEISVNKELEQLRRELRQHADIINRLQSSQEYEAQVIFRQLRSTRNVSNVLSSLKGAAHTAARPSELETDRAVLPSTNSSIEFELGMLHQLVFPILPQLDLDSIDTTQLLQVNQHTSRSGSNTAEGKENTELSLTIDAPPPLRGMSPVCSSAIVGPLKNRQYCDDRLNQLQIGYWTRIPISDEFAASVLSYHLETYHAIFGCVDCDLFLSDLVGHKLDYCSPFLLSAIMSFACQSYSTFNARSSALSNLFIRDAGKLWRAEQMNDSAKNLAALCYLTMACTLYGDEELRLEAATETRAMAKRMSLIDVRRTDDLVMEFRQLPANKLKELSHAAWGIYGALSFLGSYFTELPIAFPPFLPVPGDFKAPISFSDDIWMAYPLPDYMGRTFPTLSALWIIVQGIRSMYFSKDDTPIIDRVPLAFMESKYQELLAWAKSLSKEMLRGDHSTVHVFIFHGLYHCAMLSLLRPLQDSPQEQVRFRSFSSPDATPCTLYSASMHQLRQLMVAYCTASPPIGASAWFNSVVLEVGADLIQNPVKDANWHFYFKACIEYWKKAYVRYRTFYAVAQAMLASAIKANVIDYSLAAGIKKELRSAAPHHDETNRAVSSATTTFELALAGTGDASVEALVTQFDEMSMIHELTNWEEIC